MFANFDLSSFVVGGIVSVVGLIVIMAIIVPDELAKSAATWVVTRKNVPTMLMPFGIIALVVGLGGLAVALYAAFSNLRVVPGIWLLIVAGVLVIGLYFATHRPRRS